ncbi:hypothetical protein L9F63_014022 [Diploptera punctata]|uniref:Uncharacterized protein n=1 Tax=Diploptera punctata TaxID=6984 RepID=A0AAD8ELI2_DIPPU|nr:hypothetical protein L9F63_014022 [Diploptera punctata]
MFLILNYTQHTYVVSRMSGYRRRQHSTHRTKDKNPDFIDAILYSLFKVVVLCPVVISALRMYRPRPTSSDRFRKNGIFRPKLSYFYIFFFQIDNV